MVQPSGKCFASGAGDGFVAVSATFGVLNADQWIQRPAWGSCYSSAVTVALKCNVAGLWHGTDRPTDRRIAACFMPPPLLKARTKAQ